MYKTVCAVFPGYVCGCSALQLTCTVCICASYNIWIIDHTYYLSFSTILSVLCLFLSSPFSFLSSCFVGQLSGVRVRVWVCVTATSLLCTPAPSRSWEVTQFPMIQCGCFCCVVAVAILRGPLMPTVTAPWIMDRESDRVLHSGGKQGEDEWREGEAEK